MTDLVERYVHKVGSYLSESEREEVQNELRSLLYDQLDDRFKGEPTEDDVVELLTEFGDPREMAASYGREQYLIGPDLYPTMVAVLQRGWMWVPIIVVLVRVIAAFASGEPGSVVGLFLGTFFVVLQALFVFSGIVVVIFAILQHEDVDLDEHQRAFDPLNLPRINDPAAIDKGEVVGSIAFSTFWAFILFYFLRVGGLTMRFNIDGVAGSEVLAVPTGWLITLLVVTILMIIHQIIVLRRGRWSVSLLLAEMGLELVSAVAGYYVLLLPLSTWLFDRIPALLNLPFAENAPLIAAVFFGFITLIGTFSKMMKIIFRGRADMPSVSFNPEG